MRGNPDKIRAFRFKKGQSGNPKGRPPDVLKALQKHSRTTEALKQMYDQDPRLAHALANVRKGRVRPLALTLVSSPRFTPGLGCLGCSRRCTSCARLPPQNSEAKVIRWSRDTHIVPPLFGSLTVLHWVGVGSPHSRDVDNPDNVGPKERSPAILSDNGQPLGCRVGTKAPNSVLFVVAWDVPVFLSAKGFDGPAI
jgi:Family of unknown function (DUF5681)